MSKNPIGYTVYMYGKSGGCIGTWKRTMKEVLEEIITFKPHDGIIVIKQRYNTRMNRYVINRAKDLDDSGIYPKTQHNQCDICGKKFSTAIGFHRHYPRCITKNLERKTVEKEGIS